MNFEEMSINDLKQYAKEKGLKNISKLKKSELIEMLQNEDKGENIEDTNKNNNIENNLDEENFKITNEGDTIASGILEVMPDGFGFLKNISSFGINDSIEWINPSGESFPGRHITLFFCDFWSPSKTKRKLLYFKICQVK